MSLNLKLVMHAPQSLAFNVGNPLTIGSTAPCGGKPPPLPARSTTIRDEPVITSRRFIERPWQLMTSK
eukprot:scaffold4736_cov47-Prasinocladus_malaysianus.AAC.1